MDGQLSELREMLAEMEIAFLTTIGSDGHLRSRPMQLQRHDPDGTLWFATSLDSHKIDDVRHDGRCCVAFLKDSAYVSISGRAELVKDRSLIEKMWKPTWRGWFPEGPGELAQESAPGNRRVELQWVDELFERVSVVSLEERAVGTDLGVCRRNHVD